MRLFRRADDDGGSEARWTIVGLGNPGDKYARTRHNAGVMVLDVLAERSGARFKSHKSGCLVAEARLAGEPALLARPTSYMNESGRPVGQLLRFYKTPLDRFVVVHDEIDIPFGDVRIKLGGGTAGHNGVKSLADHLGTKDFVRVRVGVGRPKGRQDPVGWVLTEFSAGERKEVPFLVGEGADAIERIIEAGVERAMNEVNTRGT